MSHSAGGLHKALQQSYFCRACLLVVWLVLQVNAPALAQKFSCTNYSVADTGQELPGSMWSDIGYYVTTDINVRAQTRDAMCAMSGSSVKRGAFNQARHFCYVGCNPLSVWTDGLYHYCEKVVEASAYVSEYSYTYLGLHAKHRCAETNAQLIGPKRLSNSLDGTEQGIPVTLQLSEHAKYFTAMEFFIDPSKLKITSNLAGSDNRLSDDQYSYLSLPPLINGTHLVDGDGKFTFRFFPQKYFLSRPVKEQTLTVSATCRWCQNTATLDIHIGPPDIVIGFFNGVANTRAAAQDSLDRLKQEFGSQHKDTPLKYDWFYNQTACGEGALGKLSCLEDVAEVFEQRSLELGGVLANRWETFWDILAGRQQQETSFTGSLLNLLGDGTNALLQLLDATASAIINQLTRDTLKLLTLFTDSPTYENRTNHLERLMQYADEGLGLLLVAHSQGNLFVNSAYGALKASKPDAPAQVVHVAPASPTLRGEHLLADIDLVINGLRISGLNSVPDVNINLPLSKIDPSGHGFEPTYLDTARAAYARTRGLIVQSLDALAN